MEHISASDIDIQEILNQIDEPSSGAEVIFIGRTRNHNEGKAVESLEYEAHPRITSKMIDEIIADAHKKWSLEKVICVHRVGQVKLQQCAVLVVTLSAHRDEAYQANRYIIDRVKHEAPIWKKEYFRDGTSTWSKGCEHETANHSHHSH